MTRPVVFTNGCFDLWHSGHAWLLYWIEEHYRMHTLVVGVNSDASVRNLKGPERPINTLEDRMLVVAMCRPVKFVLPFDEDTPEKLVEFIKPAVIVKDESYVGKYVAGEAFVRNYGGWVDYATRRKGTSSTDLIQKVREGWVRRRNRSVGRR
jgi:D-beta-D-heptose 7-phosphate kinase/D-beta-D-heptose 1-phosphate adenosyltransferase